MRQPQPPNHPDTHGAPGRHPAVTGAPLGHSVPGRSALPRGTAWLLAGSLASFGLSIDAGAAGTAAAASRTAATRTAATRTAAMAIGHVPCATSVSYSYLLGGRTQLVSRRLPAPASRVGGAALAAAGAHVTPAATAAPPTSRATAWLVADLDTGQVLAACNAHVPLGPASCLKVLTALALMPLINPAGRYPARAEDAQVIGTRVGLVPGSVYTVDNLWHALLLGSANDAAVALARLAGGQAAATEAMRRTARALGALDTVPRNTSGLDAPGQASSAYDLAVLGRAALADPRVRSLVQTRTYSFPGAGTALPGTRTASGAPARRTFPLVSHDRLLSTYPGALGVKNGWTSTTGGSFIGAAQRDGRRLIATMIAADPDTAGQTAELLDWGFAATPARAPGVGRL
ncbi:MAG TPA: serine hydrolase [Kineosporiaceae bacterium]